MVRRLHDCTFATIVTSNDDNNPECGSFGPSYAEFVNDGSTNYIIRVDGFNASSFGAYELTIGCMAPPPPPECPVGNVGGSGAAGGLSDNSCPVDDALVYTETTTGTIGTDYAVNTVTLNISHTWVSDLEIKLVAPDGVTSLDLTIANGGSGDDYTDTVFQDGGGDITAAAPPYTGTFAPQGGDFATAFAGQAVNGDWTLAICDSASGDVGTVNSWLICFSPLTAPAAAATEVEIENLNVLSQQQGAERRAINVQQKAEYKNSPEFTIKN